MYSSWMTEDRQVLMETTLTRHLYLKPSISSILNSYGFRMLPEWSKKQTPKCWKTWFDSWSTFNFTSCESFFHLWEQSNLFVRYERQSRAGVVRSRRSAKKTANRTLSVRLLKAATQRSWGQNWITYLPTRWMYDSTVVGKSKLMTLETFWKSTPLETPNSLSLLLK